MANRYAHPTQKDAAKFLMRAKGLPVQEEDMPKPKTCPRCKAINPYSAEYCATCSTPLDEIKYRAYVAKKVQDEARLADLDERLKRMERIRARSTVALAKERAKRKR
jgi:ribosomal protein L40E